MEEELCFLPVAHIDQCVANEHIEDEEMVAKLVKVFVPSCGIPTVWKRDLKALETKPMGYLASRHFHPRDRNIVAVDQPYTFWDPENKTFRQEDCHSYFINDSCENIISVTTLDGLFWESFDAQACAAKTLTNTTHKTRINQKSYKYRGCHTVNDILDKYTESRELGSQLHALIELHINNLKYEVRDDNKIAFQQFLEFRKSKFSCLKDFRTEWAIYDDELRIAGKIDYVGTDADGNLVIIDWKRVEDLTVRPYGQEYTYGKSVLCGYPDTKLNRYSCQVGIYKRILETKYGYKVSKCFLVQFHPTLKEFLVYPCVPMQFVISRMFALRRQAIARYQFQQLTYTDGDETE